MSENRSPSTRPATEPCRIALSTRLPRATLGAAAVLVALAMPTAAHARSGAANKISGVRFELHANADAWEMLGLGLRVEVPIVPDGFLNGSVKDELALSLGGDLFIAPFNPYYYYGHGAYGIPIGVVEWNLYLNDKWSVFPEAGLAFHVGFLDDEWNGHHWWYAQPDFGIGARYHFNTRNSLVFRVSTPGGLQIGFTF